MCAAYSGAAKQELGCLPCIASCKRPRCPALAGGALVGEADNYAEDFYRLASQHRRYVEMLENLFATAVGSPGPRVVLPPVDTLRRLIAVEYARLHFRLKTDGKRDASVEGYWLVRAETIAGSRVPQPLLSELVGAGGAAPRRNLAPAAGPQPRLRFSNVRGGGDELYDLVGFDGLVGCRPGHCDGEILVFITTAATASAVFRRLTGQLPTSESTPVRADAAGSSGLAATGLRVALEQTLGVGRSGAGTSASASGPASSGAHGDGWDAVVVAKSGDPAVEPVLESWEDAL